MNSKKKESKVAIVRKMREQNAEKAAAQNDENTASSVETVQADDSQQTPAEAVQTPKKKGPRKPPGNKRAYSFEECCAVIKLLVHEKKSSEDTAGLVGRPHLSLRYKFFTSNRGVRMARDYQAICKHFGVELTDEVCEQKAEEFLAAREKTAG